MPAGAGTRPPLAWPHSAAGATADSQMPGLAVLAGAGPRASLKEQPKPPGETVVCPALPRRPRPAMQTRPAPSEARGGEGVI